MKIKVKKSELIEEITFFIGFFAFVVVFVFYEELRPYLPVWLRWILIVTLFLGVIMMMLDKKKLLKLLYGKKWSDPIYEMSLPGVYYIYQFLSFVNIFSVIVILAGFLNFYSLTNSMFSFLILLIGIYIGFYYALLIMKNKVN